MIQRHNRFEPFVNLILIPEYIPDEQLQADHLRDVLTIAFSHPAVSIVMWQIWGEAAGRKALWRPDWSIKPAGQAWLDLVHRAWWTNLAGKQVRRAASKGGDFSGRTGLR